MSSMPDLGFLESLSTRQTQRSIAAPATPVRATDHSPNQSSSAAIWDWASSAPARQPVVVTPTPASMRVEGVTPGSYWAEMSNVEYHTMAPGESSSRLKHILVSPGYYQLKRQRPTIETDALRIGRMLHTTVLEPHLVDDEFAIWKDGRRQGTEWEIFKVLNSHKTIITQSQLECAQGMAQGLRGIDDFPFESWLNGVTGIEPAIKERSLFWIDEETGLQCKARPDCLTLAGSALAGDVKSARSASPDEFIRDLFKFRYDLQAAHYLAGIKAVFGVDANFAFFVAEKEAPHVSRTFIMSPDAIAHGERFRRYCLRMVKKCNDENSWPKQPAGGKPVAVEAPFWEDKALLDMAQAYGVMVN